MKTSERGDYRERYDAVEARPEIQIGRGCLIAALTFVPIFR